MGWCDDDDYFSGCCPRGHFERGSLQEGCRGCRFAGAFNVFCFQSFCGRAASQALSEVCFVSPESLLQRQGKCRAIIPICPALLHMELALLNILN